MLFFIEEAKETILGFSGGTVMWIHILNIISV